MVGVAGFEPAAHWSQTSCATKLRYTPLLCFKEIGRGSRIRTHGTWFWRPLLYQLSYTPMMAEKMGFEPMRPLTSPNDLANRPLQPLEYFSKSAIQIVLLVRFGGGGGIRTHGPFRNHWFSRPAP